MLYQLPLLAVVLVVVVDLSVCAMLIRVLRQPHSPAEKWAAILGVGLLFLPLCGYKLLLSSPGTLASTPGLVTVLNPAQRFERVYYLARQQSGSEEVYWVSYLLTATDSVVFETEGGGSLQAAVY
ncbi:hypothetical protein [Hymenobacter sp. 102]|uniref:hypothetical protein n=1 Tax=Hymenobacter sp. 102 TaxID=3403152 RepID=UPI003CEA390B